MIWTIARKELLDHFRSAKFLVSVALTVVLAAISTGVSGQDFRQRQQDFLDAQREMKGDGVEYVLLRAPQVLSTLINGKDRILGNKAQVSHLRMPAGTTGYMGEDWSLHTVVVSGFAAVDFAFLVRVVLSLVVLFLAYNAVSEEKSNGTLRLVLANPVARHEILVGKFIGGIAVVGTALLAATAISLLLIALDPKVALGGSDWVRIAGIVAFSALYLVFFYVLGLFVSVRVDRPSTALMVVLQVWIVLVVLYPNLATMVAASVRPLPSAQEIAQEKAALFEPHRAEFDAVSNRFEAAVMSNKEDSEASQRWKELWILQQELNWRVDEEQRRLQNEQASLAKQLSLLSPAVLYDRVVTSYAQTDLVDYDRFMGGVYRVWKQLADRALAPRRARGTEAEPTLPTFVAATTSWQDRFVASAPEWTILLLLSVLLFVAAYVAFLRKDAR